MRCGLERSPPGCFGFPDWKTALPSTKCHYPRTHFSFCYFCDPLARLRGQVRLRFSSPTQPLYRTEGVPLIAASACRRLTGHCDLDWPGDVGRKIAQRGDLPRRRREGLMRWKERKGRWEGQSVVASALCKKSGLLRGWCVFEGQSWVLRRRV
jgi:hypothetical protein